MTAKERLAARLLATFLGELDEQLRVMNADLLALESRPEDGERIKSLFRVAHTLKGAARAAGVPLVEEACHALEALLVLARERKIVLGADQFALLFAAADALADAGPAIRAGHDLADSSLARLCARLRQSPSATLGDAPSSRRQAPPAMTRPPVAEAPAPPRSSEPERGSEPDTPPQPRPAERGEDQLRLESGKVDALFAAAGDLSVAVERIGLRSGELRELTEMTAEWAARWRLASRRLRVTLERTRAPSTLLQSLGELEDDLRRMVRDGGRVASAAASDARAVQNASHETADRVYRLRTRPFADACEALPRVVRDLATSEGKDVQLRITGADVEADRAVLDGLREAILHLVRNAVDHGIEEPPAREAAGKPRQGTVTVGAALRGDRIVVTVSDDGAGLDAAGIRRRLERQGRTAPVEEREVARALFDGGISTRAEATAISGRGVGLDLVRSAAERLSGTVDVAWSHRRGTTFTIECPVTLATTRGLLVRAGGAPLVVPTAHVRRIMRVRSSEIRRAEGRPVIPTPDGPVPLVSLARVLGPPLADTPITEIAPVVLLHAGDRQIALTVDTVISEQQVMSRPIARAGRPMPHLSGAAILASGEIALVINPPAVIASGLGAAESAAPAVAPAPASRRQPRILVADDSITTRTLEQSLLEAAGYQVATAVDGADGWRLLQEGDFDLVVADVEMPRMDGFALCEAIRASKRLARLPVILVTALETAEHRARGHEAGADAYIGKSSFDRHHLLDTIRQLVD